MPDFGITDAGFRRKTASDIQLDLEESMKAEYGQEVNLLPDSNLGRFTSIGKNALDENWQLAEAVYQSQYPDSAEQFSLDSVAALVGITRLPATFSTVLAALSGTPGTVIPIGRVASVISTDDRFETLVADVIGGGGTVNIDCIAQVVGAVQAPAGTLTQIETPVSGWDSVTNALDAVIGNEIETDAAFRLRIQQSLQVIGAATVDAIRARLVNEVATVSDAFVFENDGDVVDGDGRPPHSFEAVVATVSPALDQAVIDKIWEVKAAGIQTFGNITGTAEDSKGLFHSISYSHADPIDIWMHVEIKVAALFDQGAAQNELVTIDAANTQSYIVTINNIEYSYPATAPPDTPTDIATALVSIINTGDWIPVTATDNLDGTFNLVSDLNGNGFTVLLTTDMSLSDVAANSGGQQFIISEIIEFAEGDEDTLAEQVIGSDVIIDKYNVPVFNVDNITEVTIYIASSQPTDEPPGAPWIQTNLTISSTELATFDTTRVTVEIIP